jgi:hypothetical protein
MPSTAAQVGPVDTTYASTVDDRCIRCPPNSVRNAPGSTINTRTPNGATSAASASPSRCGRTFG